ncbi:MAG: hypothetical protein HND52_00700 [Ignavibacteriae bacterium]|nr:hypothetical protein [Ignavibacteriota bacterium]NOG96466.1 hypothetical protein [Ignavibacteriota bacterium]
MKKNGQPSWSNILRIFLQLVAVHSFVVGVGLIIMPTNLLDYLGFHGCTERFFPTQGGVFHIVMAIGYLMAASKSNKYECMIIFSIIVKMCATLFLLTYYIFVAQTLMILFSGITDCIMGIIIWQLYSKTKYTKENNLNEE